MRVGPLRQWYPSGSTDGARPDHPRGRRLGLEKGYSTRRRASARTPASAPSRCSLKDDANRIVHFSEWTSTADARKFFESDELVRIREEAGVRAPEFIYLEELDSGRL